MLHRSLQAYVQQRSRIAGGQLIANGHPYLRAIDVLRADLEAAGGRFVSFANYDYLGLARDPRIIRAACDAAATYGLGAGASRLVGGERSIHSDLEREISEFVGVEDTLVLVSGYMTNMSFIGHVLTSRDLILVDEFAHNSIMMGSEISRASSTQFKHNDLAHLEELLQEQRDNYSRVLVVVEGLYSMDGDLPDLPRLIQLKDTYDAWLMVDEAHSIGVLGPRGRGLTEHWGVEPDQVDFIIGTLSKSFVSVGGFISGKKAALDWLRFTLPGFVYSVGLPPMIAAAVRTAIRIVDAEPWRLAQLHENSQYFAAGAASRGFDIGSAVGAGVIPILFDDPRECMSTACALLEAGYYAPPIMQVAVSRSRPRIRCFACADHTKADIDGCLDALAAVVEHKLDHA